MTGHEPPPWFPATPGLKGLWRSCPRPPPFDEGCRNKGLCGEPWGPGRTTSDFVLSWVGVQGCVGDKDKRRLSCSLSEAPCRSVRGGSQRSPLGASAHPARLLLTLCPSRVCCSREEPRVGPESGQSSPSLSALPSSPRLAQWPLLPSPGARACPVFLLLC